MRDLDYHQEGIMSCRSLASGVPRLSTAHNVFLCHGTRILWPGSLFCSILWPLHRGSERWFQHSQKKACGPVDAASCTYIVSCTQNREFFTPFFVDLVILRSEPHGASSYCLVSAKILLIWGSLILWLCEESVSSLQHGSPPPSLLMALGINAGDGEYEQDAVIFLQHSLPVRPRFYRHDMSHIEVGAWPPQVSLDLWQV